MNYSIKVIKQQNELCQWVELYKGTEYIRRLLMHNNATVNEVIEEYRYGNVEDYKNSIDF